MARFHDGHLGYRPPPTAAPRVGYTSFRLGLKTVLGKDQMLVSEVEPGSEVAIAGVLAGDEVTSIDGRAVTDVLKGEAGSRADARPRAALESYTKTWTSTLVPKGDPPRERSIVVARRSGGEVTVKITPHLPAATEKREDAAVTHVGPAGGDVAVVTIRSLESKKSRVAAIDKALAEARRAKGIVIDLRGNRGGIDYVGNRVVAGLVPGKALIARYRVLAAPETLARRPQWKDLVPESDGFSAEQVVTVDGLDHPYAGKIAIVIDAGCISTCETVTSALRADVGAVLLGEVTGGSSGAPVSVTLPASHGTIQIPTWNLTTVDGKTIEDDGITPDVEIYATPDALADHHDAPLDAAIAKVAP
jgi:C-terminal processing protease CtpA/Prc